MKKVLFPILILLMSSGLSAQTVDEILANYLENTGGVENWKKIETQKIEGKMSMQGMEFPGTIIQERPNKQHMTFDVQGKKVVQAYDGETAWQINPFQTGDEPAKMTDEEAEDMVEDQFEDDFIDYAEKGHKVELEGTELIEGAETFKIKLTKKSGTVEYHFFDQEYFVPIMQRTTAKSGPMKGMDTETYLSDYQEVDGMMVPFSMETKINGQSIQVITITDVAFGIEIEEDLFSMPGASPTEESKAPKGKMNLPEKDVKSTTGKGNK